MLSSRKITYFLGRLLFSLFLIAIGYHMFQNGHQIYNRYLHALRKLILPESQGSGLVPLIGITFERLNQIIIKFDGALFVTSGLLILIQKQAMGSKMLIVAVIFILLTKDNPFLKTNDKLYGLDQSQRILEFLKHLSLIGVALIISDKGGKEHVNEEEFNDEKVKYD
ncbi:UNKNOWN [Stylonychia lemnae]|uniref:DoxX family protein n=1 Tax=Stylonychia lemnae TaxID=5949 RepID=A0A077ZWR5_STYLE|nr:UNKNOWN [Stylonychia lemnae]|eukprot:CDW74289.1 UNKNOWN [Stylonychia lemnae]